VCDGFPGVDIFRVVKKEAADSTLFFSVGNVEVVFGSFGKEGVSLRAESVFCRSVEVMRVFVVRKSHWSQVVPSSKPRLVLCFDVADVHVNGGRVRVAHVGDEADACGEKGAGTIIHGKMGSTDAGPVDGCFFKNITAKKRDFAAAAGCVIPGSSLKAGRLFELFKSRDDGVAECF